MGYLMLVSGRYGLRAGLFSVAGVTLGLAVCLVATLLGLAELVVRWPVLLIGLRWAGIGYIVWLAWSAWRVALLTVEVDELSNLKYFQRGVLTNILNPKAAIFYLAILPAFVDRRAGNLVAQSAVLGGLHIAVSLCVHTAIVVGGTRAKPALARLGTGLLNKMMAVGLLAVAVWLVFATATPVLR